MKKILFLLLVFINVFTQESYRIVVDPKFSPYVGAEDLLTAYQISEFYVKKTFGESKNITPIGIIKRTAEMIFIYQPLANLAVVTEHEVFGHGYRIRDISNSIVKVQGYKIDLPFPYGNGGGATFFEYNEKLTSFQRSAISIGGVEADAIFANRLKMKFVSDQVLDPLKAILYLNSYHDITVYILSMDIDPFITQDGHDIENYIFWLNNSYYDKNLSKSELRKQVLINFADPFTYYSFGSYFYYIFTGKTLHMPMINIKNVKYLFNARIGLAPYGVEYYLDNFFSYKNRPIYGYLKGGRYQTSYFGAGIDYPTFYINGENAFGFRIDVYYQPKMYFKSGSTTYEEVQIGYSNQDLNKNIFGSSIYFLYDRKIPVKDMSFHLELGYKTKGFIQGESLRDYFNFRIGFANKIF